MRIGPWILWMAALGCNGGGGDDAGTGDTGAAEVPTFTPNQRVERIVYLSQFADTAQGKILYEALPGCAECHAFDGSGTADFPPLTARLPGIDDTRVATVILDGIFAQPGRIGMPPYREDWNDTQIAQVIAYIRLAFDPAR